MKAAATGQPATAKPVKRRHRRGTTDAGAIKIAHRRRQIASALEREPSVFFKDLAKRFSVDPSTITRDLQAIREYYESRAADKREVWLGRLLRHWEAVYGKAETGWLASTETRVVTKVRDGDSDEGSYTETTTEERDGNPSFLAEQRGALMAMAKLLGLDAPKEETVTVKDGAPKLNDAACEQQPQGCTREEQSVCEWEIINNGDTTWVYKWNYRNHD